MVSKVYYIRYWKENIHTELQDHNLDSIYTPPTPERRIHKQVDSTAQQKGHFRNRGNLLLQAPELVPQIHDHLLSLLNTHHGSRCEDTNIEISITHCSFDIDCMLFRLDVASQLRCTCGGDRENLPSTPGSCARLSTAPSLSHSPRSSLQRNC